MRSLSSAALLIASIAVASMGALAAPTDRAIEPERLVFLLEYVGTDYAKGVRDGRVIDESEYGETLQNVKQLIRQYEKNFSETDTIAYNLNRLLELIEQRAASEKVFQATRMLLPAFAKAVNSHVTPSQQPNLASGARLWASDCAPCHGVTANGDGPAADGLNPRPPAFHDLDRWSPRRIYDAVSFGVEGTAMPSFASAYSEQQRWDVAFFAMTWRSGFNPVAPVGNASISLDEIASLDNAELLARLRQKLPDASSSTVDYLRANVPAPRAADAGGGATGSASSPAAAALQLQDAFTDIAARVFPNVVGVSSYDRDPAPGPTPTRNPSGAWTASAPDAPVYPGARMLRSGTGFMLSDDGYVLSRDFLLRNERGELAQFVSIELPDGSNRVGKIVGTEPTLDFAVLQLAEPTAVPALAQQLDVGNSDSLKAGQWIIALGDPPGTERTFAVGVVSSAPVRQCYQDRLSATLVQSSITVPPASLGGPVVDISGRVVGITVNPRSQLVALATIFADKTPPADTSPTRILPINLAMNLFNALLVAKSHDSPWIGISVLELQSYRRQVPSPRQDVPSSGVYIDNVFDPSPASRGGVRVGDFLLALNGHELASVADFQKWMYVLGIGTPCEMKLVRDGKPVTATVTIEARPTAATPS